MSADWGLIDFLNFLDLIDTPYPNQPYGNTEDSFFAMLAECIDNNDREKFIYYARKFVLYHAGLEDADKGKKIHDYVNQFCDRNDKNHTGPDFNEMRKAIWGEGEKCGKSYYNYQPCMPLHLGPEITNADKWQEVYRAWYKRYPKLEQKFIDARIRFMDKFDKWQALAVSESLHCSYNLLCGGLRGQY